MYTVSLLEIATVAAMLVLLWRACRCIIKFIPIVSADQYYDCKQKAEQEMGYGEPTELVLRDMQPVRATDSDDENETWRFMQQLLPVMETSHGATSELVVL